jgi:hypothetical protein
MVAVPRLDCLSPTDGLSAASDFRGLSPAVPGRASGPIVLLLRSVPVHGGRPDCRSAEPAVPPTLLPGHRPLHRRVLRAVDQVDLIGMVDQLVENGVGRGGIPCAGDTRPTGAGPPGRWTEPAGDRPAAPATCGSGPLLPCRPRWCGPRAGIVPGFIRSVAAGTPACARPGYRSGAGCHAKTKHNGVLFYSHIWSILNRQENFPLYRVTVDPPRTGKPARIGITRMSLGRDNVP